MLTHPLLSEAAGLEFTETIFELWDQGYRRCASSGQIEELSENGFYAKFLSKLCENSPVQCPGRSGSDLEALSIIVGLISSCIQGSVTPRARLCCLELLQLLVPLASQEMLLEQIIPYSHLLMTDQVAKIRARAVDVLSSALAQATSSSLF